MWSPLRMLQAEDLFSAASFSIELNEFNVAIIVAYDV